MKEKQKTIGKEVVIEGIGLHTGTHTRIKLIPEKANKGIYFVRMDLENKPVILAKVENVVDIPRATVLEQDQNRVYTVEHLLATLYCLEIDNLRIEMYGEEVPVLDGSAIDFVKKIKQAGIVDLEADKIYYAVSEPLIAKDNEKIMMILPSQKFEISCTISFEDKLIKDRYIHLEINPEVYEKEVAIARTFGFKEDVEELINKGLIKGANLENALVLDKNGNIIKGKLRIENEFVRHKILDILGDISLVGVKIKGHIIAIKNGHFLNIGLAKKISEKIKYSYEGIKKRMIEKNVDINIDINQIMNILPHKYPFLLVDRIIGIEDNGNTVYGLKNITINEEFFCGHFPGHPIMPGVLQLEAMAQVGAVMLLKKQEYRNKLVYFMGLENVKWRRPIIPGDRIIFKIQSVKIKRKTGVMRGEAYVDGNLCSEAELKYAIVDK